MKHIIRKKKLKLYHWVWLALLARGALDVFGVLLKKRREKDVT